MSRQNNNKTGQQTLRRAVLRMLAAGLSSLLPMSALGADFNIGGADGSFENGFAGMSTEGVVQQVSDVGPLVPTQGGAAALLTNEPDAGPSLGDEDVSRIRIEGFTVPAGAAELRLDYDFLSNEPYPSFMNDVFTVRLHSGGVETVLLREDTFAPKYPAKWTGYERQTGFRGLSADVSAYAGTAELLTLELELADDGDGRIDSAVLVDNLYFAAPGEPKAGSNVELLETEPGAAIQLDADGSTDDGSIDSYLWDMGNGDVVVGPKPFYVYGSDGIYQGRLTVTDDLGNTDTQEFQVLVGDLGPEIVSVPVTIASQGVEYLYQVQADDAEVAFGDVLSFELTDSPAGMIIEPATGLIGWTPDGSQLRVSVSVKVTDGGGLEDTQSFDIVVGPELYMVATDDYARVYTARSNGDGTFQSLKFLEDTGHHLRGAAIADFDKDGDFDLVAGAGNNSPYLHPYYYEKDGAYFKAPVYLGRVGDHTYSAGTWQMDMAAEDFTNDGHMDLVLTGDGSYSWLLTNQGTLEFSEAVLFASDFEADNGGWAGEQCSTAQERDSSTAPADGGSYSMRVYATADESCMSTDINPSSWTPFSAPFNGTKVTFSYRVPPGVPVGLLFRVSNKNWIYLGGSPAASGGQYDHADVPKVVLIDDDTWHTATIDLYGTIQPYWSDAGSISEFEWWTSTDTPRATAGQEFWFDNFRVTGRRYVSGFDATVLPSTGGNGRGTDAGDADGDGNMDFARARYSSGEVHLYRGDGTGSFMTSLIADPGSDPYGVVLEDFDSDGMTDLIAEAGSSGDPYFYRGRGDGTFQSGIYLPSLDTGRHSAYGVFDFDHDGNQDVVATDYDGKRAWFYPGNGDTTFGSRVQIGATSHNTLGVAAPAGRVIGQPFSRLIPSAEEGAEGVSIDFDASGTTDDGTIVHYAWDFGDGTIGSGASVSHTFAEEGNYRVVVTVTDDEGKTDRSSVQITVKGNPPVADPGGPYAMDENEASAQRWTLMFDGSASSDAETSVVRYEWDFGDGFVENFDGGIADGWTPLSGTWEVDAGAYRQTDTAHDRAISLAPDVTTGDHRLAADILLVEGDGHEAMLVLHGDEAGNRYEVVLRGRGYNDVLLYRWVNHSSTELFDHNLPHSVLPGTTYRLAVEYRNGTFEVFLDGKRLFEYTDTVTMQGRPGLTTYRTHARFDNVELTSIGEGVAPRHAYTELGTYPVKLTVYDEVGQPGTAMTTVSVLANDPPTADITGSALVDESAATLGEWLVGVDLSGSTDDFGIAEYSIDWGDGNDPDIVSAMKDDFDDGDYLFHPTWTPNGGVWSVVDGQLHQTDTSGGWKWLQELSTSYRDFELEVDFKGVSTAADGYMGIVFRNSNGSGSTNSYLMYSLNSWDSWRLYDWSTDRILADGGTGWDPGTWYHLRLRVESGLMQLFVTPEGGIEALQVEFPVARHPSGGIGLLANTQSLIYDNVRVTPIGSSLVPVHPFADAGNYDITLTVTDHAGQTDSATHSLQVLANDPPIADAGGPYVLDEWDAWDGQWDLILDATGSSDDFGVARYSIDFGDGISYTTAFDDGTRGTYFAAGTDIYGYDVPDARLGRIIAIEDGTDIDVIDLSDNSVIETASLNRFGIWDMSPGDGVFFKVKASKPVVVLETDFAGHAAFAPSLDDSPVGHEFLFRLQNGAGFFVFAHEDALVRFHDHSGALSAEEYVPAGTYWQPSLGDWEYRVVSSGRISMQTTGGNDFTTVPSDNGSPVGTLFYFATHGWESGTFAVFGYEPADIEVFDLDSGESLYTRTLAQGEMWFQNGVGSRRLRLEATGAVEVWSGDTQGGAVIDNLGDDISVTSGRDGTSFYLHNLAEGIAIFAPNNNTDISVDGGALTQTLNKDGYWYLLPTDFPTGSGVHEVTASKPVIIQTLGGDGGFDDLGTWLGGVSARHRYMAVGNYTVTLTAIDHAGQTHVATTTVDVQQGDPPSAAFVAPSDVDETYASGGGWSVDFDASGSTDDSDVIRYEWDFGDGATGTGVAPTHVYGLDPTETERTFTVELTVTDRAGQQDTTTFDVTVSKGAPPVANSGGPYTLTEANASRGIWTGNLDATASTDDVAIYDYRWIFRDDFAEDFAGTEIDTSRWIVSTGVTQDDSLTVVGAGNWANRYAYSQRAFDRTSSEQFIFQARITPVNISGSQEGMWGVKNLYITNFHYNQLHYAIYFDDGVIRVYESGTHRTAAGAHGYTRGVPYDIRITVRPQGALYEFKDASAADWTTIYESTYSTSSPLRVGGTINRGTFAVDDLTVSPVKWGALVANDFDRTGVFDVELRVRDNGLQEAHETTTVTVEDGDPPVAKAGGPYEAEVGSMITFNGTGSTDDVAIQSYEWGFGDVTAGPAALPFTGQGARPQHFYRQAGTYEVELTVTDNTGKTSTDTATVNAAVGDPPQADAGGPYVGGIDGPPVYFNGTSSFDDFGIVEYRWDFDADMDRDGDGNFTNDIDAVGPKPFHAFTGTGAFLTEDFSGPDLDTSWIESGATLADEMVSITGAGSWTTRYLASKQNFGRDDTSFQGRMRVVNDSGNQYGMWGLKTTSTNYDYRDLVYAVYFRQGGVRIYESGNYRGEFGSYTTGIWYEVRIDVKASGGATYFYREAGAADWTELYDSSHSTTSPLKLGTTINSGIFELDDFFAYGSDGHVVTLTVEDGAGQTSTDTVTVTAPVNLPPHVIAVPWVPADPIAPHEIYNGKQIRLKGIVRDADPLEYQWDFGDGTASAVMAVTDPYDLSIAHTYPDAADGTPFVAKLYVWDSVGQMGEDTYNIVVKPENLTTEINVAIDEGLWRLHQAQNHTTTSGYPSGFWRYTGHGSNWEGSPTASAIQAFEINGHFEYGDHRENPYAETLERGLKYLFSRLRPYGGALGTQTYGEPDTNGNGIGIETDDGSVIYQGGPIMDAIASTRSPLSRTVTGPANVARRSYFDVLTDMVDQYAWGQDDSGGDRGGWRYSWNSGADNSAAQWGAIGMQAAEDIFSIPIPPFVKSENYAWLRASYDGTGFGYTGGGNDRETTPSGMVQLAFDDRTTEDGRWITAERWIAQNWASWSMQASTSRSFYALFAFTKAMRLALPEPVIELRATGFDWFNDPENGVARILIDTQDANGSFEYPGTWVGGELRNAFAVIMLSRTLFVQPPVADAGRDTVWAVDLAYTFDASGSNHPDPFRSIVRYEWDFDGDGTFDYSSNEPIAEHTYRSVDYPGVLDPDNPTPVTITARLRVTDDNVPPLSDTDTVRITVAEPPHAPIADAGDGYICTEGLPCELDGSGSFDIDPGDLITLYEWDLDGFPLDFTSEQGVNPSPVFSGVGVFPSRIALRVWDNGVLNVDNEPLPSEPDFANLVVVENLAPVADANGPYEVDEGSTIALDASGSSDPNGDPLSFAWDYDNDNVADATGVAPNYTGIDKGLFTVELTVADGVLSDTTDAQVTVNNVAPTVDAGPDPTIDEGDTLTQSGSFADPGADTWTATVDYGDGSGAQPLALNGGKTFDLSHAYADDGLYTVSVTVTDDDGGVGIETLTVTVNNVAPQVNVGADQNVDEGGTFTASGNFTDPGADTWTATVDYGDGSGAQALALNPDNSFDLSHVYDADGAYTVTVTVNDDEGGTGSDSLVVTVGDLGPTAALTGDAVLDEGQSGSFDASGSTSSPDAITSYEWDWGYDGVSFVASGDTGAVQSHTWLDDGTYTVAVKVMDDDGSTDIATLAVTVNDLGPTAQLAGDTVLDEGQSGSFDASGSTSSPDAIALYQWDWEYDGVGFAASGDTGAVQVHTWPDNGSYTVAVRITDDDGSTKIATLDVTVANLAPVVEAAADQSAAPGEIVSLAPATFTDAGLGDTHTATVDWGDGSPVMDGIVTQGAGSGDVAAEHSYAAGIYTVTVTVTDDDGGSGSDTLVVQVSAGNIAPIAVHGGPYHVEEGTPISLDGSGSSDPDNGPGPLTYDWDLNNDGVYDATGPTVVMSADDDTSFVVALRVSDGDREHVSTTTVTVLNVAPSANAGADQTVDEGDSVSFAGSFTDPGSLDSHGVEWSFGDGTTANGTLTPSHVYADDGVYTVALTVTDDDGGVSTDTLSVTVNNVAPSANAGPDQTVDEGDSVSFAGSFTDPGSLDSHSIEWSFGDGTTANGTLTPSHVYADDGVYTVALTVTDDDGGVGTDSLTVTVNNLDPCVDTDEDGVCDEDDNCVNAPNPGQEDGDTQSCPAGSPCPDGLGDACDNCPDHYNPEQDPGVCENVGLDCDVEPDGDIDRNDLRSILRDRGQMATGPNDPRDPDEDGWVTTKDVRICGRRLTP